MDFQTVSRRYQELREELAQNRLTETGFADAVAELRLQDETGRWWQVNRQDGGWLQWNGSSWEKAEPLLVPGTDTSSPETGLPSRPGDPPRELPRDFPQSLPQLFGVLAKGLVRNAPGMLLQGLVIGAVVWIAHAYFLIVVNNGYLKIGSWAAQIVALDLRGFNNVPVATFLWALVGWMLSFLIFNRLMRKGPLPYARDVMQTPRWILQHFQQSDRATMSLFFFIAAASLVVHALVDNIYLSAAIGLAVLLALTARLDGLLQLTLKLGYADLQRIFRAGKPARPFNDRYFIVFFCGILFSAVFLLFLPFKPYSTFLAAGLFLGAGIFFIARPKVRFTGVLLIVCCAVLIGLFLTEGALAHDGGWDEYGRNFGQWWRGAGRNEAMAAGNRPALGAVVASLLSAMGLHISDLRRLDPEMRASVIAEAQEILDGKTPAEREAFGQQRMADHRRRTEAENVIIHRDQMLWEWSTWGLEWVKYGCDTGVEVLSYVTGPVGRGVRRGYRVVGALGEGIGEASAAEPGERAEHLAAGLGRATGAYIGGRIKSDRWRRGFEIFEEGAAGGWQRGREAVREGEDVMGGVVRGFVEGTASQASSEIRKDIKNPLNRYFHRWAENMAREGYRAYIDGKDTGEIKEAIRRGAREAAVDETIRYATGQTFDRLYSDSGAVETEAMQDHIWRILSRDGNDDQLRNQVLGDWAEGLAKDEFRDRVRDGVLDRAQSLIKTGEMKL